MIAKAFLAGSISALVAAVPQMAIKLNLISAIKIDEHGLSAFFIFALIEEVIKFAAVYLVIRKSAAFDEPIDAMIYTITAGLGFAALENILFLSGSAAGFAVELIVMRFVGATLLHAMASGFVGFYWMRGRLTEGLTIATLLHTGFNLLLFHLFQNPIYATGILVLASFPLFHNFDTIKTWQKKLN